MLFNKTSLCLEDGLDAILEATGYLSRVVLLLVVSLSTTPQMFKGFKSEMSVGDVFR